MLFNVQYQAMILLPPRNARAEHDASVRYGESFETICVTANGKNSLLVRHAARATMQFPVP